METELEFIQPLDLYAKEKPYWLFLANARDQPNLRETNVVETKVNVPVEDIRGRESQFRLETNGFQYVKHGQTFTDFDDASRIVAEFLPQVQQLIQDHIPYAERVYVYDWRTRLETTADGTDMVSPSEIEKRGFRLAPSTMVHADSTEFSLLKRVRQHFPEEADELIKGRVQMINFWRPMYHPVHNWPLVLCDARTVNLDRLVAVDQVYRHFIGDVYYAKYDPSFRWCYKSEMGPDEAIIFKSWDTADVPVKTCIHSSTPRPPETLPEKRQPRASIECRVIVFSPNVEKIE
ncbi:hypothetical protein SCUCBS95973_009257 [Sporothrix curviconia]|uniref:Methyltransferase n=1 Tax=Sporothrix curviconia TaxID=1260050 RepID=A0ABP0CWJ4_9PEZI